MPAQEGLIQNYISVFDDSKVTLKQFIAGSDYTKTDVYKAFDSYTDLRQQALWRQGKMLYKNENWLRKQYVERKKSTTEIASDCNVSAGTIHTYLEKYDIERRGIGEVLSDGNLDLLKDGQWLRQKYITERLTGPEIAEIVGASSMTVYAWLERHDIERQSYLELQAPKAYSKLSNEQWLKRMYVAEENGSKIIADKLNVTPGTVLRWVKKHGIETRDGPLENIPLDHDRLNDEEELRHLYHSKEMSLSEIANELETSYNTVYDKFVELGIERRDVAETVRSGSDHHMFKEKKTINYGPNWEEKRLKRRVEDQARCQACGKTDAENIAERGRVNSVHHITPRSEFIRDDYTFDYEKANRLENLITLCDDCHGKYEGIPIDNR